MSLTAVQPDQAVIDGLSLDAAWKHAEMMVAERDTALRRAQEAKVNMDKAIAVKNAYYRAILGLLNKYGARKGDHPLLAELEADLLQIHCGVSVE